MAHNHPTDLAPRLPELRRALLHDWDDTSLTEAALCERHRITPDQLRTVARLPDFAHDVRILREIRAMRRPHIESSARDGALAALCQLMRRPPDNATQAKESRLAVKQLLTLLDKPAPQPDQPRPAAANSPPTATQQPPARPTPPAVPPPTAVYQKQRPAPTARSPAASLLQRAGAC